MAEKKNELVEVFIPRNSANKDPNYFVAVNGKSYLLPRGKKSKVPPEIAAEINRAMAAEDAMYAAQEKLQQAATDQNNAVNQQIASAGN